MDSEDAKLRNIPKRQRKNSGNEITDGMGKLPPQALELEEAVLGAIMTEKDALTDVIDILRPESFYKEAHQKIYAAIQALFNDSEPVDLLTVSNKLRQRGELEMAGGAFYLVEITAKAQSAANIEHHARIVVEHAIKRELISVSTGINRDAFEATTDVFEVLDSAEKQLYEISESNFRKSYSRIDSVLHQAIEELEMRSKEEGGLTGVPSGFTALDRVTAGWQKSDLVIIAARPAMGKTAFVLSTLRNAAVDHGVPVAMFSLEMSDVQLVNRLLCAEAELESEKIKRGELAEHEWAQLHHRIRRLSDAKIFIDDTPGLSVMELRAKCRRLKQKEDIGLVIVDYLQLMTGDASKKGFGGNREQEISFISRSLKNLAKELNVPVIALSQLSRNVESRGGDKRPQLSDLRESGAIEQDADIVMFLYRAEYYNLTEDEEGNPTAGVGEIIIAKHRNGSLDTVKLRYIGKYTKFQDLAEPGEGMGEFGFKNSESFDSGFSADVAPAIGKTFGSKINKSDGDTDKDFVPF